MKFAKNSQLTTPWFYLQKCCWTYKLLKYCQKSRSWLDLPRNLGTEFLNLTTKFRWNIWLYAFRRGHLVAVFSCLAVWVQDLLEWRCKRPVLPCQWRTKSPKWQWPFLSNFSGLELPLPIPVNTIHHVVQCIHHLPTGFYFITSYIARVKSILVPYIYLQYSELYLTFFSFPNLTSSVFGYILTELQCMYF